MIRVYKEYDIPQIVELISDFEKEFGCFSLVGGIDQNHFKNSLIQMRELLRVWVSEEQGVITCALAMFHYRNHYSGKMGLEEFFWFSRKEYRGNKQNALLFQEAEKFALDNGIHYIAMSSMVNISPDNVEKFYMKNGFQHHQNHFLKRFLYD
jgi:GNAT superfamily N-acetyltransferase